MTLQEKLYHVPLDGGEIVYVKPLSPFARRAILDRAEELFPNPKPTDFEIKVENAAVPLNLPPEMNEGYQAALEQARRKQLSYYLETIILSGVICDTPEGKAETIKRYAPQMDILRSRAKTPLDEWTFCVMHCLIATSGDIDRVRNAAQDALSEEEILMGMKSFRRDVQRQTVGGNPAQSGPPGLTANGRAS